MLTPRGYGAVGLKPPRAAIKRPFSKWPRSAALCFGELLWDSLPEGLFPGGAPCNVAYHLHHQGVITQVASAVGRDWLGDELLRRLRRWGLGTGWHLPPLPRSDRNPVAAAVGRGGDVRYTITAPAAWDHISAHAANRRAAAAAQALVFGTLAQRSAGNRAALSRLLAALPAGAESVFDINLRPPYDDPRSGPNPQPPGHRAQAFERRRGGAPARRCTGPGRPGGVARLGARRRIRRGADLHHRGAARGGPASSRKEAGSGNGAEKSSWPTRWEPVTPFSPPSSPSC